ncbi:transcription factor RcaD [Anabaena sp. UHCC 0204]|uniref:transcription factor RcaD n=1 Tax=Anabaena sp. UHCC 0204 TaxID=2590009 RepID=UPI001447EC7F|nr:transcription factor RcaD [Anabaena sp. UHCC 0204]MTJ06434.1 transcription factor RcaD [Anabaena sp. UHCC 0204]
METKELKFILKLLGCPNYRTGLSSSTFDGFKSEKNKICRDLGDRELVDYSREIATVKILPPGQALLKLDPAELPITDKERKVLDKLSKATAKIAPSEITSLKAAERAEILKSLNERGLISAEIKIQRIKAEVWLTERGIEFLRDEYIPNKGANPVISLELLGNYLRFLRKNLRVKPEQVSVPLPTNKQSSVETIINPSDEEILQLIEKLDQELGTENYLPIFHLRQKLQPPMSREELDQALYRLQVNNHIELSTLAEPDKFTSEQLDAGIFQRQGSLVFFITLN